MLSTYGRGRGSLVQKAVNINNIHKMESSDREQHAALTAQVYGITADQGVEKGIADMDTMEIHDEEQGHPAPSHLYPNALWMPEHLHIYFNALGHAVCKLESHKHWINRLRQVATFLPGSSLRRLLIRLLMNDNPGLRKQLLQGPHQLAMGDVIKSAGQTHSDH